MLETIKFATLVVTALLGIYGSFFNLKNNKNKITSHGWICIIGIIFCAITSGSLQLLDDAKSEEKSIQLLQQNNFLLESANRNLTPLYPLVISTSLRPDLKLTTLASFLSALQESSVNLEKTHKKSERTSFGSQTLPSPVQKPNRAFFEAVCSQDTSILFFKSPISTGQFNYSITPDYKYDLMLEINNPCKWYDLKIGETPIMGVSEFPLLNTVFYKGRILDAHAEFKPITVSGTSSEWKGNGRIVSVLDLLNSTMIVQLYNWSSDNRSGFSNAEVGELRRKTELIELQIKLPNGALLVFDEDNLIKHINKRGEPYYSFKFPDNLDELLKITKHDQMKLIRKVGFSN